MFNLFENFSTDALPKEADLSVTSDTTTINVDANDTLATKVTTEEAPTIEPPTDTPPATEGDAAPVNEPTEDSEEDDDFSFAPTIEILKDAGALDYDENKEYEDSDEGFAEVVKDTVEKRVKQQIEGLGEEAVKAFDHIKKGGKLADLIEMEASKIDFSKINLEDADVQQELITDHLAATGLTPEEIEEQLETLRDLGEEKLKKQAAIAQRYLSKEQDKREAEFHAKTEQARVAREKADREAVTKLEDSIFKSTEIAGFELTKEERQQFRDYVLKRDKTGKTQYERDMSEEKSELELAFLKFKKIDASYVDSKIETKKTLGLKKALSKHKDTMAEVKSKLPIEPVKETVSLPKSWFF